jgi:hypothetical protein
MNERDTLLTWLQHEAEDTKKTLKRQGERSEDTYLKAFLDGKLNTLLNTIAFIQTDGRLH